MSYTATDKTTDGAFPVEFFEFSIPGSTRAWRYCSSDQDESLDGVAYQAVPITRGSITLRATSIDASTTVTVADDNPMALALYAGLSSRPVQVVIRERHRTDPALQAATIFIGLISGGPNFQGGQAVITCGSRYALASKRKVPPHTFQAGCNWEWGGEGCGINKATYAVSATLQASNQTGRTLTVTGASSSAAGYFTSGYVQRDLDGDTRFVEEHSGSTLLLDRPWPDINVAGEGFKLYPGCKRTEAYCTGVFNNLVHFLGYARLPSINPYNRSAFYQTAASETYDPGDSWDAGSGVTVVLEDQTATIDGQSVTIPYNQSVGYTLALSADGFVAASAIVQQPRYVESGTGGYTTYEAVSTGAVMPGASWVAPRSAASAQLAALEVRVTTATVGGNAAASSGAALNTWIDAATLPVFRIDAQYDTFFGSQIVVTRAAAFTVQLRQKTVGVIRAQGVFTISHSALVSGDVGA